MITIDPEIRVVTVSEEGWTLQQTYTWLPVSIIIQAKIITAPEGWKLQVVPSKS